MLVLITRAEPEASATAARVLALGHEPLLFPTSEIKALPFSLPDGPFDEVIVTSANALRHLPDHFARVLADVPVSVVGEKSRTLADHLGFGPVVRTSASAADLARVIGQDSAASRRFLYLAGARRKPDLERDLMAAGHSVLVCETYVVVETHGFPPQVCTAMVQGGIDAVLHYSRDGAVRYSRLAEACGGSPQRLRHLCLSSDVASGLLRVGPADILVAERPDEASLLALLELPR